MSDDLYYEKYLKYKAKYMDLKYGGKKVEYKIYTVENSIDLSTKDQTKLTEVNLKQLISERIMKLLKEKMVNKSTASINEVEKTIVVLNNSLPEFETILKTEPGLIRKFVKGTKKLATTVATTASSAVDKVKSKFSSSSKPASPVLVPASAPAVPTKGGDLDALFNL
jgi:hypothetical protein